MNGAWIPKLGEGWPDNYCVKPLGSNRAAYAPTVRAWATGESNAPELLSVLDRLLADSDRPGWADYGLFYDSVSFVGVVTSTGPHVNYVYVEKAHRRRRAGARAAVVVVDHLLQTEPVVHFGGPFSEPGAVLVRNLGGSSIERADWRRRDHANLFPVPFGVQVTFRHETETLTVNAMDEEQAAAFGRSEWAAKYSGRTDYPTRLRESHARAVRRLR